MAMAGLLGAALSSLPVFADERIALIVGNSAYTGSRLPNPVNDAALMSRALQDVGFRVTTLVDADRAAMEEGIRAFGGELEAAGEEATGLFFYAGHGAQWKGENYLLPLEHGVTEASELDFGAVKATSVLDRMERAHNRLNVVILDACRNLPFPERSRSGGSSGLARMEPPSNSLIAFSTAPNAQASDGPGQPHSPYASALAAAINEPGLRIVDVFRRVREAVERITVGEQSPTHWDRLSSGYYYFQSPQVASARPTAPVLPDLAGRDSDDTNLAVTATPYGSDRPAEASDLGTGDDPGWVLTKGKASLIPGLSIAKKQARRAAYMQAIEARQDDRGVTVSWSLADNMDRRMFIKDFQILDEGVNGQFYEVQLRALVEAPNPNEDAATLVHFFTLMEDTPKVLFMISEHDEQDWRETTPVAGQGADTANLWRISYAEQFMAQVFRDAGYEALTSDDIVGVSFVDEDELRTARQSVGSAAARIGKIVDADAVIVGTARYEARQTSIDGTGIDDAQMSTVSLIAKAIVPSTGKVMDSFSYQDFATDLFGSRLSAQDRAIKKASAGAAQEWKWQLLSLLAREEQEVILELQNVSYRAAEEARLFLDSMPGFSGVRMEGWRDNRSRYAISSQYAGPRGYDLAGAMQRKFTNLRLVEVGQYQVVGSF